jgi:hypothetical protein
MPRPSYTITAADVGKMSIQAFSRNWSTAFMGGPIREIDIGRRIYHYADREYDFLYTDIGGTLRATERLGSPYSGAKIQE